MSHTPGPWGYEWSEANKSFEVAPLDKEGECDWAREICITADDSEDNARLIAAAPTGHELIQRAVADRIDDQWLKDARTYLEAVNATR